MDVYVITGEIEYEGSTVLGVAGTLAQASAILHAYAEKHGVSLRLNEDNRFPREWFFDVIRGDDWDIAFSTLSLCVMKLDAELV
jgi:hypothetical protein